MPIYLMRNNGDVVHLDKDVTVTSVTIVPKSTASPARIFVSCAACGVMIGECEVGCSACGYIDPPIVVTDEDSVVDDMLCYDVLDAEDPIMPWEMHGLDCACVECSLSERLHVFRRHSSSPI
jgi:hypothetical protein